MKRWLMVGWRVSLLLTAISVVACYPGIRRLRLATTTTTIDSGLLAEILPDFERTYHVTLDVIAVGTGEALALGRAGDVDVVLVHARQSEDNFVAEEYGVGRRDVMYNDFVLIGPPDDPAGVAGGTDVLFALSRIQASESPFVSRGDQSGTHQRERQLWQEAELDPHGSWYQEVGQGMGATLTIASEEQAYTLSDRGTFLVRKAQGLDLEQMVEDRDRLFNPYGVIAVNPEIHQGIESEMALKFIEWITSPETQDAIDQYRVNGQQLFFSYAAHTG